MNDRYTFILNKRNKYLAFVLFIVKYDENDELIKNNIFNDKFDKNILRDTLPKWFYNKYMKIKKIDN